MLSLIPLGPKQALTGSVVSVEAVVLAAAPLIAHTCPATKRQIVHPVYTLIAWGGANRNLRMRVAGSRLQEIDDANFATPQRAFEFGNFVINAGDTVSVTTQNAGSEGGTMRCTVAILDEVSI